MVLAARPDRPEHRRVSADKQWVPAYRERGGGGSVQAPVVSGAGVRSEKADGSIGRGGGVSVFAQRGSAPLRVAAKRKSEALPVAAVLVGVILLLVGFKLERV